MGWGGYLLHELWPRQTVFIDGQTDFYGEELFQEYITVSELHDGWQDVLDRHGVQWVIYPTDSALIRRLKEDPRWHVDYADSVTTVIGRGQRT
jgi:hypothetical protein